MWCKSLKSIWRSFRHFGLLWMILTGPFGLLILNKHLLLYPIARSIWEMIASSCCLLMPLILDLYQSPIVNLLRNRWRRNGKRWIKDKQFLENLKCLLETQLPIPPDVQKNEQQVECGICYAQSLPIDEELRHKSGTGTDYTCDNTSCKRAFHSICLVDWLRSITTTRQYVKFLVSQLTSAGLCMNVALVVFCNIL
ncbi:E3 ubiquitin-protein ligase FANCL-like isoform X4 [Prunus avium]|uniref:E3 ubiquitin-protein ligase FANCL-like isoform X4 n=1 Tax=Prunus avium TaxID=42229 RepID=A0A6P5RLD5_PRUAV|nr:E3 ubiquitin-protein ligase FANCL-like isoform X4 [Prunus avium]